MSGNDYSIECSDCPLNDELNEYYRKTGIAGLYDDFSAKLYEICEKCAPGMKSAHKAFHDALMRAREIEAEEGSEVAISALHDSLGYCKISVEFMASVADFYNGVKNVGLDELAD